jgi:Ca2+-binding RTX toxin-like protein
LSYKRRFSSAFAIATLLIALLMVAPAEAAKSYCFGSLVTIKGDSRNNTIRGTSGPDVVDAKGGNDKIYGLGGDDVLCGGNGDDLVVGGGGSDFVLGGGANDVLKGSKGEDLLYGMLGNDEFIGGPGTSDVASYLFSDGPVNANLATGRASGGEGSDTFDTIEYLFGSLNNDVLIGNADANGFSGDGGHQHHNPPDPNHHHDPAPGDDLMDGQGGDRDLVFYVFSETPVTIDVAAGTATGEGTDSIPNNEGAAGSDHDDTILGTASHDLISGGGGDDLIDGRGGFDVAVYALTQGPVNVNLGQGTSTGDGTDTFRDMEAVYGTEYDDVMVGSDADNVFFGDFGDDTMSGGGGDDIFYPDLGDDHIDGGAGGKDQIDFYFASNGVTVDMAAGTATGDGADTFSAVEFISGSEFNDVIMGSALADLLMGWGGNDTLVGNGGDDAMDGGDGTDSVDGGPGNDICRNQESVVSCEGQGGPSLNQYGTQSRSAGDFQRKRAH